MDTLTFGFVGVMFIAALLLTLNVRNHIQRQSDRRREQEEQLQEDIRRQSAIRGNTRSATRR
jgi:hypothetical protein